MWKKHVPNFMILCTVYLTQPCLNILPQLAFIHSFRLKNCAFKNYKKSRSSQAYDSVKRLRSKKHFVYNKLVESCFDKTSLASKVLWNISSIFELSFYFREFCDDVINIFSRTRKSTWCTVILKITILYSQKFSGKME